MGLVYTIYQCTKSKEETEQAKNFQSRMLFLVALSCCLLTLTSASCPSNLADVRSEKVKSDLDANKLQGFWYENAYQDLAQVSFYQPLLS